MSDLKRFTLLCEKVNAAVQKEERLIMEGVDITPVTETYKECIMLCLELGFSDKEQRENIIQFLFDQKTPLEVVDGDTVFNIESPKDAWEYILNSEA